MKNFILSKDNVFSNDLCDEIIKYYNSNKAIEDKHYNIIHHPPIWGTEQVQQFFDEYLFLNQH